jgi:hypothetical protein
MDYPGAMRSRFIGYLSAAWYLLLAVLWGIGATIASNNFEVPNDRVGLMRSDNVLILFAVIHAVSNLHALKVPDVFNWYGYFYVRLGWTGSGPPAGVQMLILIRRFRIPSYVFNLQEYISVAQMLILMWMFCTLPKGRVVVVVTRNIQRVMRLFLYTFCMDQLLIYHVGCSVKAYKARDTTRIRCFRIPSYVFNVQEYISAVQALILIWMFRTCPQLYFLGARTDEYYGSAILSEWCPGAKGAREHIVCSQPSGC